MNYRHLLFSLLMASSLAQTAYYEEWLEERGETLEWPDSDMENEEDVVVEEKYEFCDEPCLDRKIFDSASIFGDGIYATGEYLYWRAEQEGLTYALQADNTNTLGLIGEMRTIEPHYNPGFRVGLNFDFCAGWELQGLWTSYKNHKSDATPPLITPGFTLADQVYPEYANSNFSPLGRSATASWKMKLGVLDLLLARSFYIGKQLSIRPSVGFKAAWINQKLSIDYFNISINPLRSNFSPQLHSNNRNDFQGFGPRLGFETTWPLFANFSLMGRAVGSLLWSNFKVNQYEKNFNDTPRTHLKNKFTLVTAVIELFGGVSWSIRSSCDNYYLSLYAGWEEQLWFDQNQLNIYLGNSQNTTNGISALVGKVKPQSSNLGLEGWTFGAQLGF